MRQRIGTGDSKEFAQDRAGVNKFSLMTRRRLLVILASSTALAASSARADDCDAIRNAIAAIDNDLFNIDAWVATTGADLVLKLEQQAIVLGNSLAKADDAVSDANINVTIGALSVLSGAALLLIGPTFLGVGGLIVTGLFVSNSLMVAKFTLTTPSSADVLETGVMRVVGDIDRVMSGLASEGGTVVARNIGKQGARFVGIGALFYDFIQLVKAGADRSEKVAAAEQLRNVVGSMLNELDSLKQPGNLRTMREEALNVLRAELEELADSCDVDLPLT
jgi:hypothetical protein